MQSQLAEKVDVSRILIHCADGRASVARVTSVEAANAVLRNWAQDASGSKRAACEVEIEFEDGLRYYSHYPLKEQEKNVSLSRHMRRQLTAMTKAKSVTKPEHAANDAFSHTGDRDPRECAEEILAHYNI